MINLFPQNFIVKMEVLEFVLVLKKHKDKAGDFRLILNKCFPFKVTFLITQQA